MSAVVLFWSAALALVYTYVGYPVLLLLRARLAPRAIAKAEHTPTVTAVMTVYNGAADLARKLDNLLALDYPPGQLDIVVACDGSADASAAIARGYEDRGVTVLVFEQRRGKAACLNDAVAAARGELLLLTDVRQRIETGALRALAANFADPAIGAAGGELSFEDPATGFAASVDAYWRYEKAIRKAESDSGSVVGVSGALYAMRRALFQPLPPGTVLDDVLVPMRVVRAGGRVVFEPAALAWDRASATTTQERARKLRTLAGNFQLLQLAPWLLLPGVNPIWLRFVSHKLLRLLSPWWLLLLLVTCAVLWRTHGFYALTGIGLVLAAALMVAGSLLPAVARLLPVRVVTAFFHMNVYAAQALWVFLRNRRLHLW